MHVIRIPLVLVERSSHLKLLDWHVVLPLCTMPNQGKSNSLVQAIQSAHDRDMSVIAITGSQSSNISALLRPDEVEICVPSEDNAMIYGAHLLVLHCLCDLIDYQLFGA